MQTAEYAKRLRELADWLDRLNTLGETLGQGSPLPVVQPQSQTKHRRVVSVYRRPARPSTSRSRGPEAERQKAQAIRLRGEGKSLTQIAQAIGRAKGTVANWLAGIPVPAKYKGGGLKSYWAKMSAVERSLEMQRRIALRRKTIAVSA